MGIILGALAGGAEASLRQDEVENKSRLDLNRDLAVGQQRSDLDLQRTQALEVFRNNLKNAPLNRLSASAKKFAGEEVPQEAAPVTSLSGLNPRTEAQGPGQGGFTGDPKAVALEISKLPDGPDKVAAMEQLRNQFGAEEKVQAGIVNGKTRKRTSAEAKAAAVEDAGVNDLPALAAYEAQIGKPARDERRVTTQETREENRMQMSAAAEERKAKASEMRDATTRYVAELKDATNQDRIEKLVGALGKNGKNEALSFIDGARKDVASEASQVKNLYQTELKDVVIPSKRALIEEKYKPQFEAIEKKRRQLDSDFNALREGVGLPPVKSEETPAPAGLITPSSPKPTASAPLSMPSTKAGLKVDSVYQTARGPARWNGTAFEAQ